MNIVVLDGYTLNPGDISWDRLKKLGQVKIHDRTPEDKILERSKGAEIIITNKTPLTKETLKELGDLKYIGVIATGYNVVDVEAARDLDIVVTNIPTYGVAAVAQMATALLLELCHNVGSHNVAVQEGEWTNNIDWCFWNHPLTELDGKTLGLIGFGRIGQKFAEIAQAMGMNILAYDEYQNKDLETDKLKYTSLENLLATSDVISLHCPLFESTEGMINKDSIAKMKDGVMIINTARGPLIVEEDLADALNSGKVAGAAMDVLAKEPPTMDNPLINAKNCIITPHIAWASTESRSRLMDIAVDNLESFISGKPENVVN